MVPFAVSPRALSPRKVAVPPPFRTESHRHSTNRTAGCSLVLEERKKNKYLTYLINHGKLVQTRFTISKHIHNAQSSVTLTQN